jgi:hypothetical protein
MAATAPHASGREWQPVAQPNLAAELEAAPQLKFEELVNGSDSC